MEPKTILSSTDRTDRVVALIAASLARWLATVDSSPDIRVYADANDRKEGPAW
jgi:hypothetical protein